MRGDERLQDGMFSYVTLEQRVPQNHFLRAVRQLTDVVLRSLSQEFDSLYSALARSGSCASRSTLTCSFAGLWGWGWTTRCGTMRCSPHPSMQACGGPRSKNRDRLLNSGVAQQFFAAVVAEARRFMSDDHFTVDGTLIGAWASQKSFRKKDGSGGDGTNFHGGKRSNETHESTTGPDARLYKKSYGTESKLACLGHALVENRSSRRITVGADKAFDSKGRVAAAGALKVTPHITKNNNGRRSNVDRRTTRHPGYAISLSRRWLVEKTFGWNKQIGPAGRITVRGLHLVDAACVFGCAALNLLRLPRLIAQERIKDLRQSCA